MTFSTVLPKERIDPELGRVRRCSGCNEEWPADLEFFYPTGQAGSGRLHSMCKACYEDSRRTRRARRRNAVEVTS